MAYRNAVLYYWSGTGNSYRVSSWMEEFAKNSGLNTEKLSLNKAKSIKISTTEKESFIGIVFPTHGFTAPWHVLKSVRNLPPGNSAHVYCISTRAGLKFGSLFIPGISGSATFVIALLLRIKGYNVRGTMSVDMPSNWFSLHPIQNRNNHEAIIDRAEHKVAGFMKRVLLRSKVWFTGNNAYEIILGILLSFVSVGYLLFGKFFLAKLFFANNKCDGCGICMNHCPTKAIVIRGKEKQRPYWKYNCESCMKCAALCPHNAIEAGHSWGLILYLITAFPLSAYLFSLFSADSTSITKFDSYWFGNILDILYFYPAIIISYFIFSMLIKIPIVNYLFTYTTMTHLPFWGRYREPKTKLKDVS